MSNASRNQNQSRNRTAGETCQICGNQSEGELCRRHEEARRRLQKHFGVWKARTDIGWEGYLRQVYTNEASGSWIRETAGYLLKLAPQGT